MIGLDTNVILRMFNLDATAEYETVTHFIDEFSYEGFFINSVAIVEFAWVLKKTYKNIKTWCL